MSAIGCGAAERQLAGRPPAVGPDRDVRLALRTGVRAVKLGLDPVRRLRGARPLCGWGVLRRVVVDCVGAAAAAGGLAVGPAGLASMAGVGDKRRPGIARHDRRAASGAACRRWMPAGGPRRTRRQPETGGGDAGRKRDGGKKADCQRATSGMLRSAWDWWASAWAGRQPYRSGCWHPRHACWGRWRWGCRPAGAPCRCWLTSAWRRSSTSACGAGWIRWLFGPAAPLACRPSRPRSQ